MPSTSNLPVMGKLHGKEIETLRLLKELLKSQGFVNVTYRKAPAHMLAQLVVIERDVDVIILRIMNHYKKPTILRGLLLALRAELTQWRSNDDVVDMYVIAVLEQIENAHFFD